MHVRVDEKPTVSKIALVDLVVGGYSAWSQNESNTIETNESQQKFIIP